MSNIKLPDMSYSSLLKLTDDDTPRWGWVKIAYQTFVRRDGLEIEVRHFDTVIATVSPTETVVDPDGWHTSTTATRLNKVVYDNTGMHVRLKDRWLHVCDDYSAPRRITGPITLYNKVKV